MQKRSQSFQHDVLNLYPMNQKRYSMYKIAMLWLVFLKPIYVLQLHILISTTQRFKDENKNLKNQFIINHPENFKSYWQNAHFSGSMLAWNHSLNIWKMGLQGLITEGQVSTILHHWHILFKGKIDIVLIFSIREEGGSS